MSIHICVEKCVGCRGCELACSFQRYGFFSPARSNIKILLDDRGDLEISIVGACDCGEREEPLCVELCPLGAIGTRG